MIQIKNSKKKLTLQELTEFELLHKNKLSQSYKKFILKFNGGLVENFDSIKLFLSVRHGINTIESIVNIHQILENNIPKEYLPIGLDWSDNPITICLKEGNEYGKVVQFYFDTDQEPEVIANSLEELLGVNSIDEL
jgi:hypothetical protein